MIIIPKLICIPLACMPMWVHGHYCCRGWQGHPGQVFYKFTYLLIGPEHLGMVPSADTLQGLGLPVMAGQEGEHTTMVNNPLASIIPLLTALPMPAKGKDKQETQPACYLVTNGLPTLPIKLVESVSTGYGGSSSSKVTPPC